MPSSRSDPHLVNTTAMFALGVTTAMERSVEEATGLSAREVAALTVLANWSSGRSIDVLRAVLTMSQPGCARLVDRLCNAGLAIRSGLVDDRRVTTVEITTEGRGTVRSARAARARTVRGWLAGLDEQRGAELARILDELAAGQVLGSADPAGMTNVLCRMCDARACGFPDDCAVTSAALD